MSFYMIGGLQIPQRKIQEKELWYFDTNNPEGVKKILREFKTLTGYSFDNSHLYFSNIYGHLFSISIHFSDNKRLSTQKWEISVWDHTGHKALGEIIQSVVDKETDKLSDDNYKILSGLTEDFVKGIIKCSDCRKELKLSEVAGHYFAGSFCKECWDRKWKAVEAAETYD